jgi:biotin operon repressor
LKNVIFKTTLNAKPGKTEFHASDLPSAVCGTTEAVSAKPLGGNLDEMERRMIFQALEQNGGSQTKAAQQLGISSRTLRRKLEKYRAMGIELGAGGKLGRISTQQQRYYRVTIETPVVIRDSEGEEITATTVNVSSGGIAIKSPVTLRHGATFEITFSLPTLSAPLESKAKLAWTSPGGLAGLSFVEIHPVFEKQLQQWLLHRAREEGWTEEQPPTEPRRR